MESGAPLASPPTETVAQPAAPWHAIFPNPQSTPQTIAPEDLAALLRENSAGVGKDFLVIDVRRTDFEVSHCIVFGLISPTHTNAA